MGSGFRGGRSAIQSRTFRPSHSTNPSLRKRHLLRLAVERLEDRHLLAGDAGLWFQFFDEVPRIAPASLVDQTVQRRADEIGPHDLISSEWIVRLSETTTHRTRALSTLNESLDFDPFDFTVISGLGAPGWVLVRGRGVTTEQVESTLQTSEEIERYSQNQLVQGQATTPSDTDFVLQLMPGLETIGLPDAWDESIGSLNTVVAVLDTGIDLAHRDLYLNIWFNQGEIPSRFLDDVGNKLVDIDNDGLITFYDLNHATRSPSAQFELTVAGFLNGPNAEFVRDLNGNGYIDGLDILQDPLWADGRDTDGNGEVDDFFGVNFRGDGVRNNPTDVQGHGTHVAGTIGAIGGNASGVTGVNWQTSLMALRILDNSNQGDLASAIRAVNYAKDMRDRYRIDDAGRVVEGGNVRVLNNSWGQPGGFEPSLLSAIEASGESEILFVAAAGNGNFLGQGVNNDQTPFYPANYDTENMISVAAGSIDGKLAPFSNVGGTSVDIAAPGVGIRSTELGGGYGTRNGTSMATPHVAGTAALIWSAYPQATLAEVKQAIISTVDSIDSGNDYLSTGGKVNAAAAINANVFAPAARVTAKENITTSGGPSTEFTVAYSHRNGINAASLGNDDVIVTRQWGPQTVLPAKLKPGSVTTWTDGVSATYFVQAPGGGEFASTNSPNIDAAATSTFSNDTDVVISSGPPNTVTSQIDVSGIAGDVLNLRLALDIDHTYVSDLTATLIAPDGSRATLFSGIGGGADNFSGTILDDTADTAISNGSPPYTGTFRPAASITAIASAGANGMWTLEIVDNADLDGGALRN